MQLRAAYSRELQVPTRSKHVDKSVPPLILVVRSRTVGFRQYFNDEPANPEHPNVTDPPSFRAGQH